MLKIATPVFNTEHPMLKTEVPVLKMEVPMFNIGTPVLKTEHSVLKIGVAVNRCRDTDLSCLKRIVCPDTSANPTLKTP